MKFCCEFLQTGHHTAISLAMNSPRPLLLLMVPLAACLALVMPSSLAAPVKKTAPPAVVVPVEPTPAPRTGFLQKLNPFRKKDPPPAPAPSLAPAKNSKKTGPAVRPGPEPVQPSVPAPAPAVAPEEPKKSGFFSRLKSKLNQDPGTQLEVEKPERPADWKERWVVTEDSTAFFEFGPSQATGPDLRLSRGQVLKLSQASRGWAHVELDGGRSGYIGTDQMRQATESDFAPPRPMATQLASVGADPKGWSPSAPQPEMPDLPAIPGMENSQLLLPPLEFEGTELKKSSLRLPGAQPTLKPGDALPVPGLEPAPIPAKLEEPAAPVPPATPDLEPAANPPPTAPEPIPVIPPPSQPSTPS